MDKYQDKSKWELNGRFLKDEEYLLNRNRPYSVNKINNMKHFDVFVKDIMKDRYLGSIIYASNAKNEIDREEKFDHRIKINLATSKVKKSKNEPTSFAKKRMRLEAYKQLNSEVKSYDKTKAKQDKIKKKKARENYLKIKNQQLIQEQNYYASMKQNRTDNYWRAFLTIKDKFNHLHGKDELITEQAIDSKRTLFSNYNKKVFTSNKEKKLELPKVKLDLNDVSSRLFYNAVSLSEKLIDNKDNKVNNISDKKHTNYNSVNTSNNDNKNNKLKLDRNNIIRLTKKGNVLNKPNNNGTEKQNKCYKQFHLKNALPYSGGREFTTKIDGNKFSKCIYKYSCGPKVSDIMKNIIKKEKSQALKGNLNKNNYDVDYYELRDEDNNTFLHIIAKENIVEMAEYFIDKGIDLNAQNKDGDTALHFAFQGSYFQIIDYLIKAGARIDIKNNNNISVYQLASAFPDLMKKYGLEKEMMMLKLKENISP